MSANRRAYYVLAAADAPAANAALAAAGYGANSISAPLCALGSLPCTPASHYWCGWTLQEEEEAAVSAVLASVGLVEGPRLVRLFLSAGTEPEADQLARGLFLEALGLQPVVMVRE